MKARTLLPAALALVFAASIGPTPAHAGVVTKVSRIDVAGEGAAVRASAARPWGRALHGTPLSIGAEIRAGAEPMTLELANGATLVLEPDSRIALGGTLDIALGRDGVGEALRVELRRGEVLVKMPRRSGGRSTLVAAGDALVAVRRGGVVRARLRTVPSGRPAIAAALYEGDARVATVGAWTRMTPSTVLELEAGRHIGDAHPLPAAPAWAEAETDAPLAVLTSDGIAPLTASFAAIPSATGYVAEIARADTGDVVQRLAIPAGAHELRTKPLPPGSYVARLAARGSEGLPGRLGSGRALRVARVSLPPGAFASEGVWTMPRDRGARLDDPSGLELAVGRHGFSRAPDTIALADEHPTLAKLRLAGERAWVPIRLGTSTLHADVWVGPKTAVWPFDPIDIEVRLRDDARPLPDEPPRLTVTVNLEETPVAWRREGGVYRAHLEPRDPPGPWVVRVEVADAYGSEIGRGFVEVIAPHDFARTSVIARATARR